MDWRFRFVEVVTSPSPSPIHSKCKATWVPAIAKVVFPVGSIDAGMTKLFCLSQLGPSLTIPSSRRRKHKTGQFLFAVAGTQVALHLLRETLKIPFEVEGITRDQIPGGIENIHARQGIGEDAFSSCLFPHAGTDSPFFRRRCGGIWRIDFLVGNFSDAHFNKCNTFHRVSQGLLKSIAFGVHARHSPAS